MLYTGHQHRGHRRTAHDVRETGPFTAEFGWETAFSIGAGSIRGSLSEHSVRGDFLGSTRCRVPGDAGAIDRGGGPKLG